MASSSVVPVFDAQLPQKLVDYKQLHPDATYKQMAGVFGVSQNKVKNTLRKAREDGVTPSSGILPTAAPGGRISISNDKKIDNKKPSGKGDFESNLRGREPPRSKTRGGSHLGTPLHQQNDDFDVSHEEGPPKNVKNGRRTA